MKNLPGAGLLLTALLCTSLILASSFSPVNAAPLPRVYIRADGTIEGTSSLQRSGGVYTFLGTFTGPLFVERDNIVIDGAGYTLQGADGRGIVLEQRHNITVKNVRVALDGGYVIDLRDASDCTIIGNTFTNAPSTAPPIFGFSAPSLGPICFNLLYSTNMRIHANTITNCFTAIGMDWSSNNTITDNIITDCIVGIEFCNATGNVLRNNRLSNSSFSIRTYTLYQYDNDVDTSNTIDGKPIYYWMNMQNRMVPSNAAYVMLVNCTNITVQDAAPKGIILASSTNCTLSKVELEGRRSDGIVLMWSSNIKIADSAVRNHGIGIQLDGSSNNVITRCAIADCMTRGINFASSDNNLISGNNLTGCGYAVAAFQDSVSNGNTFERNNFVDNDFALIPPGNCIISENNFFGNSQAVLCTNGVCTLSGNNLTNNGQGIILQTTNNVLRNNNFLNNTDDLPINGGNFDNDVDLSNTLDGKAICYWVNRHGETVPSDVGFVVLANCTNITVQNLVLSNQKNGILLAYTTNSTVTNNLIADNSNGVYFYRASGNLFTVNNITRNSYAVYIGGTTTEFFGGPSSYTPSSNNLFYHNNFVANNQTLYDVAGSYWVNSSPSANIWDNGKEGNYWSDYTGSDANGDGIGDSFYVVYANNTDNYPLMQPAAVILPEFAVSPSPSPSATPTTNSSPQPTPLLSQSPRPTQSINPDASSSAELALWLILPLIVGLVVVVLVAKKKLASPSPKGESAK